MCLIPTTIGGLLSAIGIAGMDRVLKHNILAMSGRAVEAAGDVNVLLLDKTGTITLGNREAVKLLPAPGVPGAELAELAQLSSLADETPEGRSIVVLAKEKYGLRARELRELSAKFVPFTAKTRMSGLDFEGGRQVRKGATDAVDGFVRGLGGSFPGGDSPRRVRPSPARAARPSSSRTATRVMGTIYLKDIVKGGMKERFDRLRAMGIRTVMITGDNPLTAATIAREAGVDDFLAEATPEDKLALIRAEQAKGNLVAMTGDGTNDAPALAQADVGMAMNTGTQAAKEAGNMVDLDSNPTKLIEVVEIGKQLLMTRGALTTFSIANDVAKYFAIIPALFLATYPELQALNIMQLTTPESAILSAVVFNALIIVALIPLALRGVSYRPLGAGRILQAEPDALRRRRRPRPVHRHQGDRPSPRRPPSRLRSQMKENIFGSIRLFLALTVLLGRRVSRSSSGPSAGVAFREKADGSLLRRRSGEPVSDDRLVAHRPVVRDAGPLPRPSLRRGERLRPDGFGRHEFRPDLQEARRLRQGRRDGRERATRASTGSVPADAVTSSGSGVDPHISPEYARLQIPRVARETRIPAARSRGARRPEHGRPLPRPLRREPGQRPRAEHGHRREARPSPDRARRRPRRPRRLASTP